MCRCRQRLSDALAWCKLAQSRFVDLHPEARRFRQMNQTVADLKPGDDWIRRNRQRTNAEAPVHVGYGGRRMQHRCRGEARLHKHRKVYAEAERISCMCDGHKRRDATELDGLEADTPDRARAYMCVDVGETVNCLIGTKRHR